MSVAFIDNIGPISVILSGLCCLTVSVALLGLVVYLATRK
jgi:hypothetical protein